MIMRPSLSAPGRLAALFLLFSACTASPDPGEASATKVAAPPADARPAAAAEQPGLPDAEQLLADSVEAMGGAAKFAALTSYYTESQMSMTGLGLTGAARTWGRGGDFYTEMEMPGVGLMRLGSLGGKSWADDPINGLRALAGKEAEQAAWSTALCLAHEWKRHFKSAETTAVTQVDGKEVAEIALVSPLGDKVVLRVDLASKLPVSQTFTQASPLGDTPATVAFEDYRAVEGLTLPYRQVLDASVTKAVSTMTRLELGGPVDESRFAMPAAAGVVTPGALVDGAKIDAEQAAAAQAAAEAKASGQPAKTEKRKSGKG